jgi:putative ABC transport system permease protein
MRTAFMLASVAVGVASLILAAGFIDDILFRLREATIHSQVGHFEVFAPGYIESGQHDSLAYVLQQHNDAIAKLRSIPGVEAVAPRLMLDGSISNGRAQVAVSIEGVDPDAEARIGTSLVTIDGDPLGPRSGHAAVVGEGVARSLRLRPGDSVTLLASTREGALNTFDAPVAGAFRSPFKDYDARVVRVALRDAQELVGSDSVNALAVLLAPGTPVEGALAAARAILPPSRYDIRPWWQLADFYEATAALYRRQFLVLELIVSFMVLLGVANSTNMSLYQRQAEFGTVRALGYRAGAVFQQIVAESALLGVVAAALGVALGALIAAGVSAIGIPMPPPPNSEIGYTATIRISAWNLAVAGIVGTLAAIAGAIIPALRLTRMPIVDALRHSV